MTARQRDPYVTRILARAFREASEIKQQDLARALDRDRSGVSHMLHGRQVVPADELDIFCDYLGTEALEAIADRLGMRVTPKEREAAPVTIERGAWALLSAVSAFGQRLGDAMADGHLDLVERDALRRQLVAARELVEGMLAKIPEQRVRGVA